MRRVLASTSVLFLAFCTLLPAGFAEPRDGWSLAARVPASTLVFVSAERLDELEARLERTAVGRMLADPAMEEFIAPLGKAIEELTKGQALPPPVTEALGHLEHLRGQLGVAFVGMDATGEEPLLVASLDFGARVKDFASFLEKLLAEMGGSDLRVETSTQDGRPVWTVAIPHGPTLSATIFDTVFAIATSPSLLAAMATAPAQGTLATSADFQAVGARYGTGLALQAYANVPALLGTFARGFDGDERRMADAMGLDTVKAVGYGMSFSGDGFRDALVVHTPGADHGLLTMFDTAPLASPRVLDLAPGNAFFFAEGNVDLSTYLPGLRKLFSAMDPRMAGQMDEGLAHVNQALGVDLEKDILGGLGRNLGYYAGLSSGGGLFPELAVVATVKDPVTFEANLVKMLHGVAGMANESGEVIARPREVVYEGQKLHILELQAAEGDDMIPLTPSCAVVGDRLVATLVPYTLKDIVYRLKHPETAGAGLKDQEDFQALWKEKPASAYSFGYLDLQAVLSLLYDTGVPLLQAAVKPNMLGDMGRQVPLDWAALPPVRHVRQYFRSVAISTVWNKDGIEVHIASPIPLMPVVLAAGAAAATFGMRSRSMGFERVAREREPEDTPMPMPMESPREAQAQAQLNDLARYVRLYVLEKGNLPGSLKDVVDAGYLGEVPTDPWGNAVELRVVDAPKREFALVSYGPDGKPSTGDDIQVGGR